MSEEDDLESLLEERDRYIDELEAELAGQEGENDKHRDELILQREKIAELQAEVKQLNQENADLDGEKAQLEDQVNGHKAQIDAQKGILAELEDSKRLQKDGNQQLQRLEIENQRLRDTITEIEENEDILVNEIETLVKENSEYRGQNEELSSKCDSLYASIDENTRLSSQLTQAKEKAEHELETQQLLHGQSKEEWQRKDAASRTEIARILVELEQERNQRNESAHIRENEAFRKELSKTRRENQKLHALHDQCLRDKDQAERDLESAIQALNESRRNAKEEIASERRKERCTSKEAAAKLDTAQQRESALRKRCIDIEEQLGDLRIRFERSEERNASYEKNHGLTEAIRCQKKLEADIRRRDYDLKCLNATLGETKDKYRALNKACDWLKEKANLGPDFMFDNEEIKLALTLEDNGLKCENAELSRQIEALEGERTKLLSQLRERAIEIGDQGVRFLGMSSHQVAQIMEFASNLRRGIAELPLNDRSKELSLEIASLKSEREVQKVTIEKLEREVFSLSEAAGKPHGEGLMLKHMTTENEKLRNEIDALKKGDCRGPHGSSLTLLMQQRAKELLGEDLVAMPAAAEVQFLCLMNEFDKMTQNKKEGEQPNNCDKIDTGDCKPGDDNGNVLLVPNVKAGVTPARESQIKHFQQCTAVVNERNKKLTETVSRMEAAMQNLRNERDVLAESNMHLEELVQKKQINGNEDGHLLDMMSANSRLTIKCNSLQGELSKERDARTYAQRNLTIFRTSYNNLENWRVKANKIMGRCLTSLGSTVTKKISEEEITELTGILQGRLNQNDVKLLRTGEHEHVDAHDEVKNMTDLLEKTMNTLTAYMDDVTKLRNAVCHMREKCADSAKVAMQISCLDEIINEKNRIIKQTNEKLAAAKQMNVALIRDKGFHQNKNSDRSISTNSIDRSILRAASNSNTPTRKLQNATALVHEKETIILEQHQTILELKEELASGDEAQKMLKEENERMKTDVSTLVSRLAEAESDVNAVHAYQQKCQEVQTLLDCNKKKAAKLKEKMQAFEHEKAENSEKISKLQDSVSRAKRVLSVARQGRARSETSLIASNEEITSLKEQLEKLGSQVNDLKKEKIEAQNEKIKLNKKARLSAIKLKDLTDERGRKESSKTVEELDKRVSVLNSTVSKLASQNSKLRGELAALKLLKKKADNDAATTAMQQIPRSSTASERSAPSLRDKSLHAQINALQKSLSQEKKHALDSSAMLDRYQKRIYALEQALQSTTQQNASEELKSSIVESSGELLSLKNQNKSLKDRIDAMEKNDKENNNKALVSQLTKENDSLKKENERLSKVDHLDFFEEIEELKYKYNEAVQQINQLTQA